MDAKGKRNSKNTGKGPLDTAIRSFVPQAAKELLRVPTRCAVLYWQLELCHLPKFVGPIIGCLSWVKKLSLGIFWFSSSSVLKEPALNKLWFHPHSL